MWPSEPGRFTFSQFSKKRRGGRRVETGEKVRSFSRSFEWWSHRHVTGLPLQLDGRLCSDEPSGSGSCTVHGYGGVRDQITAARSDKRLGFPFRESCRSEGRSGD